MTRVWMWMVLGWAGCAANTDGNAGDAGGTVLAVSLAADDGSLCSAFVEENILGAHVAEPTGTDWVNESSFPRTDNEVALLGQADDGSVVLAFAGELYLGTREGDTFTGTTESGYTDIYTSRVDPADYERVYTYGYHEDSTITLTLQADGYTWSGTITDHWVTELSWSETDLYDLEAYSAASGGPDSPYNTLTNAVFAYLVIDDFVSNGASTVECEGESCSVSYADDCTESAAMTAVETNLDPASINIDHPVN